MHADTPLKTFGPPLKAAGWAAILVHGRTQTPEDVDRMIVQRLPWRNVAYVAPVADGASWYPARFMEPLSGNEPALGHALARLRAVSQYLEQSGFPVGRQLLVGFSQGACLSAEFLWRQRLAYGGLLAFTGGLIGDVLSAAPSTRPFARVPVLMTTAQEDPWVPPERTAASARLFDEAGASVTHWIAPGGDHAVRDEEIGLAVKAFGDVS